MATERCVSVQWTVIIKLFISTWIEPAPTIIFNSLFYVSIHKLAVWMMQRMTIFLSWKTATFWAFLRFSPEERIHKVRLSFADLHWAAANFEALGLWSKTRRTSMLIVTFRRKNDNNIFESQILRSKLALKAARWASDASFPRYITQANFFTHMASSLRFIIQANFFIQLPSLPVRTYLLPLSQPLTSHYNFQQTVTPHPTLNTRTWTSCRTFWLWSQKSSLRWPRRKCH